MTETETIELTNALLQCLLNQTVDTDHGPKRDLARALHNVTFMLGNRWKVEVTEEDVKTIHALILEYTKGNRTTMVRTRFHRYLLNQSDIYYRLFKDWQVA